MFTNLTYAPVIDTKNGATPLKGVITFLQSIMLGIHWGHKSDGSNHHPGMYVWKSL